MKKDSYITKEVVCVVLNEKTSVIRRITKKLTEKDLNSLKQKIGKTENSFKLIDIDEV